MSIENRLPIAAALAAVIVGAAVGCAQTDTPTSSGTTTSVRTPSSSIRVAASSFTPTTTVSTSLLKPKAVDVTVAPESDTTIKLGGPPLRFSVTLLNHGPDIPRAGLVVSLGHCSCGMPGASMMATGSMRMLDAHTDEWVDAPYVREGTGMDYITQNLVPPFLFSRGQTVTYQLEMTLDPGQNGITDGETAIAATVTDADNPLEGDRFGEGTYQPINVEV